MAIVSLQRAKDHLGLTTPADDPSAADLTQKLAAAEAAILDYIGSTAVWRDTILGWTDEASAPPFVVAAILCQLGELWRFRGDDLHDEGPSRPDGDPDFSPVVVALLRRSRDPVLS